MAGESQEKAGVLYVKTFGGFRLEYDGKVIAGGDRHGNQVRTLFQLMIHYRKNGLARDMLKAALFEDRDIDDVSHAIRNLLYNTRKRLREAGLPDEEYIKQIKGVYQWVSDIPVEEDADLFEQTYKQVIEEPDPSAQTELLRKCIMLYTGRFLAGEGDAVWVLSEAERYRQMFHDCVNRAADYYRSIHKYDSILMVAEYAVSADPFSEWEVLVLEALSSLGEYEEAERFYNAAIDTYIAEYGNKSNEYVRDLIKKLGAHLFYRNDTVDEIRSRLTGMDSSARNGYYCTVPVFQELYRTVERTMERAGEKIFLMLCTIVDSKGNPMQGGQKLDELADRLRDAIVHSVRRTDTITRYGKGQFLILLINTTRENCEKVQKHIDANYKQRRQRTGVSYSVIGIIDTKEAK